MKGWIEGIQESIDHIEKNLTEELDIEDIARKAALSSFYYQRIFGALCGMSVSEYIRARRMTVAAQELSCSDRKVIDIALKYGYDSPDSFTKAFQRFHGITPKQAKEPGTVLRSFAPMHIKVSMEGGNMLDYRIVEKAPFTIVGIQRNFDAETGYREVPRFWEEWMQDRKGLTGMFGVCTDMDGKNYDYRIADLYVPWKDIPEGCSTWQIPGGLWALFTCRGPLPDSIQQVSARIWAEWLPSLKGYTLAGNYLVEVYMPPAATPTGPAIPTGAATITGSTDPRSPADRVSYICVPLKKKEESV